MPKCTIPLQPCDSSQLKEFGYDEKTQTLAIRFNGKAGEKTVYTYANVPAELHAEMVRVNQDPEASVGKFFGEHIRAKRDVYPYTKIVETEDEPAESAS